MPYRLCRVAQYSPLPHKSHSVSHTLSCAIHNQRPHSLRHAGHHRRMSSCLSSHSTLPASHTCIHSPMCNHDSGPISQHHTRAQRHSHSFPQPLANNTVLTHHLPHPDPLCACSRQHLGRPSHQSALMTHGTLIPCLPHIQCHTQYLTLILAFQYHIQSPNSLSLSLSDQVTHDLPLPRNFPHSTTNNLTVSQDP